MKQARVLLQAGLDARHPVVIPLDQQPLIQLGRFLELRRASVFSIAATLPNAPRLRHLLDAAHLRIEILHRRLQQIFLQLRRHLIEAIELIGDGLERLALHAGRLWRDRRSADRCRVPA